MANKVYYIMGVSGSGKTTIGELISKCLDIPFYDSDLFHPEANIKKMSAGIPLNDEDRFPWLQAIHNFVVQELPSKSLIIATSALKQKYRNILVGQIDKDQIQWIFLHGDFDLLQDRISKRKGHFMPESLLQSQFDTLEIPQHDVIQVEVSKTPEEIIEEIISRI